MAVLDTNVLLDLRGRSGNATRAAAEAAIVLLTARNHPLYITCFTSAELYVGIHASRKPAEELRRVESILDQFSILEFTDQAARRYGSIVSMHRKIGRPMETIDALIAAVALAANERILVTRNVRHFERVLGLQIESY